jgi:hypothetical protein
VGPLGIESRGTDSKPTNRWLNRSRVEHLVLERLVDEAVETVADDHRVVDGEALGGSQNQSSN